MEIKKDKKGKRKESNEMREKSFWITNTSGLSKNDLSIGFLLYYFVKSFFDFTLLNNFSLSKKICCGVTITQEVSNILTK